MTCNLPLSTVSSTQRRNDLHLTSSGVGHLYRRLDEPSRSRMNQSSLSLLKKPLPSLLAKSNPSFSGDAYTTSTTAKSYPVVKIGNAFLYKKAPSLMNVSYMTDTNSKLTMRPWSQSLTMGNQCTEMQEKFRGAPVPDLLIHNQLIHPPDTVHRLLKDHYENGHTKGLKPTTTNKSLQGQPFIPQDQAVLHRNQPYMTTNNWFHRTYGKGELGKYPKKDNATYWECENYPKAWGFGTNENPLTSKRSQRDSMTDRMTFRTPTNRLKTTLGGKHTNQLVSNSLMTLYNEMYTNIDENKTKQLYRPLVKPTFTRTENDASLMQVVPDMYQSVNTTYGHIPIPINN